MNDPIAMLEWLVDAQQGIPTLAEMPRRTLSDKGIAGPTAAHVIEEIHTPLNLALVTFTTGSSAFQNIVGVTQNELLLRSAAACGRDPRIWRKRLPGAVPEPSGSYRSRLVYSERDAAL